MSELRGAESESQRETNGVWPGWGSGRPGSRRARRPLGNAGLGRAFQVWREVSSTNDLALKAAAVRANAGLVIVADSQSAGRGQRGRDWRTPRGSAVLLSVVMFPEPPLDRPESLVTVTAVAVARALAPHVDTPPQIKWPNDLYLGNRKVGGILVERSVGTVVGIGLNMHAAPRTMPRRTPPVWRRTRARSRRERV